MFDSYTIINEQFAANLSETYHHTYGGLRPEYATVIAWAGNFALEIIANSDMLYHDVEHTMMVTLAGQEILRGKQLSEGGVSPEDWLHFMVALLCHDIGYVRGILRGDKDGVYMTGIDGGSVELPVTGSDAAMTPYHVDRGKSFVKERFGGKALVSMDLDLIGSYIEMTRFPVPDDSAYADTQGYPGLVRAADFIGQLGDPHYLRKIPALFYEFEEIGTNAKIGYQHPGDMRERYAKFFWGVVNQYIQDAARYLRVTLEGKQWIANLYSHVFAVEHNQP